MNFFALRGTYRKSDLTRQWTDIGRCFLVMVVTVRRILSMITGFLRPRVDREAVFIVLRISSMYAPERIRGAVLANTDRPLFVWLYRLVQGVLNALSIVSARR